MGLVRDEGGRRGHGHKLYINSVRLDVRKFMFSNRVCQQWNDLPGENCKGKVTFLNSS